MFIMVFEGKHATLSFQKDFRKTSSRVFAPLHICSQGCRPLGKRLGTELGMVSQEFIRARGRLSDEMHGAHMFYFTMVTTLASRYFAL